MEEAELKGLIKKSLQGGKWNLQISSNLGSKGFLYTREETQVSYRGSLFSWR